MLARAALARVRKELPLQWDDVAVVIREREDETILLEIARLCGEGEMHGSHWETLIRELFAPGSQDETDANPATTKLGDLGVDAAAQSELADHLRTKASSLFVIVGTSVIRDQVLGVLRGFQGEITVTRLKSEP